MFSERQLFTWIILMHFNVFGVFATEPLLIQSTTSTKNSGFFEYILPIIEKKTGISANVIAVGTGSAINNAMNCDGDLLIVHAKNREEEFVRLGFGVKRYNLMYNDFVIVGPVSDPARVSKSNSVEGAFQKLALSKSKFASRGDDSGTNIKELELWRIAGIQPQNYSGDWYLEMGAGMGATLNTGIELNAYILTDRATWTTFQNKRDYNILFEGDQKLFNQYGVIATNPLNCPDVQIDKAITLIDWLTSPEGQNSISALRVRDQQLFFPNN